MKTLLFYIAYLIILTAVVVPLYNINPDRSNVEGLVIGLGLAFSCALGKYKP